MMETNMEPRFRIFDVLQAEDYEQIVFCQDQASGLKAIIAIHDTTLGPALGGLRMWNYASEEEALTDVLRLAKGMTYKNAAAGLNLGGGKAVIIGNAKTDKSEALFRAFGRYVQSLSGRYITAEDVNTSVADMDFIHMETDYVTGVSPAFGSSGNPSPVTAYGVYRGMKAAAKWKFGSDSLAGKTVAVQGVGNVAYNLCRHLHEEGAHLVVTDINEEALKRAETDFGATVVKPDEIYAVDCDNQLAEDRHGDVLEERGILYAPDFVINAGGVINVADELEGYNRERAMKKVELIYDNMQRVFEIAERDGVPTHVAAEKMAEERIQMMSRSRSQFLKVEKSLLGGR